MNEPIKPNDTPVVPDTQPAQAPVEAAPTRATEDALIQKDLAGETATPAAPKVETPQPAKEPDTSGEPEHPDSERMMRNDYLREKAKISAEKEALAKEREEFEAYRASQAAPEPKAPQDQGEPPATTGQLHPRLQRITENLVVDLDPEDWEHESDQVMAKYIKGIGEQIAAQGEAVVALLQEAGINRQRVTQQYAEYSMHVMDEGARQVEKSFGVSPSPNDVGEAILAYGDKVMAQMGGKLTPEVAVECWKRANVDLLLAGMRPAEKAPQVPALGPSPSSRTQQQPKNDEDRILADLQRG